MMKRKTKQKMATKVRFRPLRVLLTVIVLSLLFLTGAGLFVALKGGAQAETNTSFQLATGDAQRLGDLVTMEIFIQNIPVGGPYHVPILIETDAGGGQSNIPSFTSCTIANCVIRNSTGINTMARGCIVLTQASNQVSAGKVTFQLKPSQSKYMLWVTRENAYRNDDCSSANYADIVVSSQRNAFVVGDGGTPARNGVDNYCIGGSANIEDRSCAGANAFSTTQDPGNNVLRPNDTRSSSSSAASTASKQGATPNPIPAAAPQGEQKQPDIEPSPFYDGKQYTPGSSTTSAPAFAKANASILASWPIIILICICVIATIGGALYWYVLRRKSINRMRRNK